MSVTVCQIRKATYQAAVARDNLTVKRRNKHYAKVCCCCDCLLLHGDEQFLNLKFLNEHDKIAEKISKYKPNTQRNKYIAIVSVLKEMPNQKKNYDKYFHRYSSMW